MYENKGLIYMGAVIVFIILSSFFFKGNPKSDDDGCINYSNLVDDC